MLSRDRPSLHLVPCLYRAPLLKLTSRDLREFCCAPDMADHNQFDGSNVTAGGSSSSGLPDKPTRRLRRFDVALAEESVDKKALSELAWSGVPAGISRLEVWQILLGYRPVSRSRRDEALQRKRQEYTELRQSLYYGSPVVRSTQGLGTGRGLESADDGGELGLLRQIRKDLPRMALRAGAAVSNASDGKAAVELLIEEPLLHGIMERVLFVWAVRQPASGYVQGINDVLLPLLLVGLSDLAGHPVERLDPEVIRRTSEDMLTDLEADCYWCLTKILSEILDHYTHGQPGVQRMVQRLREIIRRIDAPLSSHLATHGVELLTTAFRWITCLMVRDLPILGSIRLWDTLIAESAQSVGIRPIGGDECTSSGFEGLLVYFCACFTAYFSPRLQSMDFEGMTFFLQSIPTDTFTEAEIEVLLGEAFVLKSLFQQAPRHLSN